MSKSSKPAIPTTSQPALKPWNTSRDPVSIECRVARLESRVSELSAEVMLDRARSLAEGDIALLVKLSGRLHNNEALRSELVTWFAPYARSALYQTYEKAAKKLLKEIDDEIDRCNSKAEEAAAMRKTRSRTKATR